MVRKVLLFGAGMLLATGAVAINGTSTSAFATPAQVLRAPVPCTGFCNIGGGTGGHQAVEAGEGDTGFTKTAQEGDGWHSAYTGSTNCSGHICTQGFSALTNVTQAIQQNDAVALARILEIDKDLVTLSVQRHSVQVKGCDGKIAANYPLTQALETELIRLAQ